MFLLRSVLLLSMLFFTFCAKRQDGKESLAQTRDLDGEWVLSNYIDSILVRKTTSKYVNTFPSWFGIRLSIHDDTCYLTGSIHKLTKQRISIKGDTVAKFQSVNGFWVVRLNSSLDGLEMRNISNYNSPIDSTTYYYRKLDKTSSLIDTKYLKDSLVSLFNRELISGIYKIRYPEELLNNRVILLKNGLLQGMPNYDKFTIWIPFGTSNPFGDANVLTLANDRRENKNLIWEIRQYEITLFELQDDEKYPGEIFLRGRIFMKLIREQPR